MTLKYIVDTIKSIALLQPNVRTATEGDVYDVLNGNPNVKYGVIHITQSSHKQQNNQDIYGFNLFYIDRLLDDNSNKLDIQSIGKELISNILMTLDETFDTEISNITYQPFTERFNDLCAGVYVSVNIAVFRESSCAEQYGEFIKPTIQVINNEDIVITDNGTYFPQQGYSGFGEVKVEIPVDDYYNRGYNEGFVQGETEGYNDGFAEGLDEGKIEGYEQGFDEGVVNGKEEQKSLLENIKITKNGIFDNENGFDVVDVDLPIQESKRVDVRYNGEYDITPDENYTAFQRLRLNVESKPKVIIPNGVNFANSTFTEFPIEDYDWSNLYDCNELFYNCKQLNTEPILQAMKDGIIHPITTCNMFEGCSVKKIEGLDFTKYYGSTCMFYNITDLEEVRDCVLSDGDNVTTNAYGRYYIYSPNHYAKVIDCDWSKLTKNYNNIQLNTWYFANFKEIPTSWQYLPSYTNLSERVFVMECDKPDTLYTDSNSNIWYDNTKYSGWDSFGGSHPYGFWYKINNDTNHNKVVKITQRENITNYQFEQILPYNTEKDCYYIDYPYSMYFDVYVDDNKLSTSNVFNKDIFIPNVQVGTFEGRELGDFIDYILPNDVTLTDNGIEIISNFNEYQRFNLLVPNQNEVELTIYYERKGSTSLYINDKYTPLVYDSDNIIKVTPTSQNLINFKLIVIGGNDGDIFYIKKITTT